MFIDVNHCSVSEINCVYHFFSTGCEGSGAALFPELRQDISGDTREGLGAASHGGTEISEVSYTSLFLV